MASLRSYRAKRDFGKTQEPRGKKGRNSKSGLRYVIQKHAARRLHYDLRLELNGVMLSWAVTRGPSLVPEDKRLAIHTEDHPIAYNDFEGTIPDGQYGGGTVMVWDKGSWIPKFDAEKGLAKGHLEFTLAGDKLHGLWHLVRLKKKPGDRQMPWLLIKSGDDEFARGKRDQDVLEELPNSAISDRSIEEIADANDRQWHSNRSGTDQPKAKTKIPAPAKPKSGARVLKSAAKSKKASATNALSAAGVTGAKKAALPSFVEPCLAKLSAFPPRTGDWVHEIKFDGYRMQARIAGESIMLKTRSGLNWTDKFQSVADALADMPITNALIDGEIVVEDSDGVSSFSALQEALSAGDDSGFVYYMFDLLHLDGYDLTRVALRERKALLTRLLADAPPRGKLRLSEDFDTDGSVLLRHAREFGLEGIISKRADLPYRSGRGGEWLKIKCTQSQEFVIAGYEPSDKRGRAIRALIMGYRDGAAWRYAGRVGTGLKETVDRDLAKRLNASCRSKPPFDAVPEQERRRKVLWVEPAIVAEVEFRGWTHDDVLRQASFKGLREDKPAQEVVRETAVLKSAAARAAAPRKASPKSAAKMASNSAFKSTSKTPASKKPTPPNRHVINNRNVSVAGIALSHPERVYWDDVGVTKKDLAEYYEYVWDWMAPHLVDRPLALVRSPDGASGKSFFQKHASAGLDSKYLKAIPEKGEQPHIAVTNVQGLVALAQAGVLEIHTWGTTAKSMETCNRLVFDLDPGPDVPLAQLKDAARDVRARLSDFKLESFLKTTGGKGLHVVVPIVPVDWDHGKAFAHAIAQSMASDDPTRYVANMAKKVRNKRVYIDYLRNGRGATAIAPYSTRARPGATVSVPIAWTELAKLTETDGYNVTNVVKRLGSTKRDPWDGIGNLKQKIPR